jgi:leucine dehydrogenase
LTGLRVAVQGVGHVGAFLAEKLAAAGAVLIVCDVNPEAVRRVAERTGAAVVEPEAIFDAPAEVFAPCALGGALSADTLNRLQARVIAGGANNQLAGPDIGERLFSEGRIYAPDYVINGGGIINVAGEIRALKADAAFDPAWVAGKLDGLMSTLAEILQRSVDDNIPTHRIAAHLARERMGLPAL